MEFTTDVGDKRLLAAAGEILSPVVVAHAGGSGVRMAETSMGTRRGEGIGKA
jgi:hypothetical protein